MKSHTVKIKISGLKTNKFLVKSTAEETKRLKILLQNQNKSDPLNVPLLYLFSLRLINNNIKIKMNVIGFYFKTNQIR